MISESKSESEAPEPKTIIRLLEDAIRDSERGAEFVEGASSSENLINPSLAAVSQKFTLNHRQHVAFVIAGAHLLDSFKRSVAGEPSGKPLRMHLAGEGGTGKSRVIDALRYLGERWGRPNAVVTVAPTGIAAVLVKGETAHSKFHTMNYFKPTMKNIEAWAEVYMVIWDEISMTEKGLFVKAFRNMRKLLATNPTEQLRVHIVTAGDFLQLPPCFGGYIFEEPHLYVKSEKTRESMTETEDTVKPENLNAKTATVRSANAVNTNAFQLWRTFDVVIRLDQNMRHANDPSYGCLLKRLRLGEQTAEDFSTLNSRYLDPLKQNDVVHKQFKRAQELGAIDFPIACQGNSSRHAINWIAIAELSRHTNTYCTPIICPALFEASKRGSKPTTNDVQQLLSLGDHELRRLTPLLPLFPGLPVHITQNISTKLGLANGSTGKIVGCQFSEDTTFSTVFVNGVRMQLSSLPPQAVYVNVAEANLPQRFPGIPQQYSNNTVPILPFSCTVPVTALPNRKFTVKMTQIPITPAFSATVHKLQGKTCDAVLAYVFDERGRQKTSLYVVCSRVTKLSGLYLYQKLTSEDLKYFRPPLKVIEEEKRLEALSENTLHKFYSGQLYPDFINNS